MEKISKVGKNFETVFEEILTENNLTQEEVIYKTTEIKKGLFKSANVEVTIYKKSDIYDFVKEFLKEIVNNLGLEVTFETKKVEDRVVIKMYSNNNNILIGHNGNTIKALENLVRQKIQLETGMFFIISLDVENYKDKKISRLERLAKQTAREVKRTHIDVHLENMNSYERRIIHNTLANNPKVYTESEGEEPNRYVVIKSKED